MSESDDERRRERRQRLDACAVSDALDRQQGDDR
jgi:hypothetical protein